MQLGADLELAWSHPAATAATRKRILRTALNEIVVRKEGAVIDMVLHWQALRERLFPGRENDRVLARGVVLVHQHEALQRACERLGVARPNASFAGDGEDIFGHLPTAVMLRLEHVGVSCRGPARLFDGREDVG